MKRTNKILLSIGALTMVITPLISATSCAEENLKKDTITKQMVHDAIKLTLKPNPSHLPPQQPEIGHFYVSLNGISDIHLYINDWVSSTDGTVKMTATISKDQYSQTFSNINIDGYLTDNQAMDAITQQMIHDAIKLALNPDFSFAAPSKPKMDNFDVSLNGLSDIILEISNWTSSLEDGTATMTALILKDQYFRTFSNINIEGYLDLESILNDLKDFTIRLDSGSLDGTNASNANNRAEINRAIGMSSKFNPIRDDLTFTGNLPGIGDTDIIYAHYKDSVLGIPLKVIVT